MERIHQKFVNERSTNKYNMIKNTDIKQIENIKNNKDTYVIRWQITSLCNYHCDFCIQGNAKTHALESRGESSKLRANIVKNLIRFIEEELNDKYKTLKIYLIGGEVTILKDFKEILTQLVNVHFNGNISYHITTNLSADVIELSEIVKIFKKIKHKKYTRLLQLSASFYKEYTTEKEFIHKIKKIYKPHPLVNKLISSQTNCQKINLISKVKRSIIEFLKKKRTMTLSISYPLFEDYDYTLYQDFRNRNLKYVDKIQYIIIRKYKKELSKNLKDSLKREYFKHIRLTTLDDRKFYFVRTDDISLEVEEGFNPRGMQCDAGVNSISIDSLGMISRCVSCQKQAIVGKMSDGKFKCLTKEFTCPSQSCSCNYYGIIRRENKRNDKIKENN